MPVAKYHHARRKRCTEPGCGSSCLIDKGGTTHSDSNYEKCKGHTHGADVSLCCCRYCTSHRGQRFWSWQRMWEDEKHRWSKGILYHIQFQDASERWYSKIGVGKNLGRVDQHLNEGAILVSYVQLPRLLCLELEQNAISHSLVGDRERMNMQEPINYAGGWTEAGLTDEVDALYRSTMEQARYLAGHPDQEGVRARAEARLNEVAIKLGLTDKETT